MNCILCDKLLENAVPNGDGQPYDGGMIQLRFCYGSCKFDLCPGMTYFDGIICDDCAEPLTKKMKQRLTGMDGKPWSDEIQAELNKEIFRTLGHTLGPITDEEQW